MSKSSLRNWLGNAQNLDLYGLIIDGTRAHEVVDVQGRSYIDFSSGACTQILGYKRNDLLDVFTKQSRRVASICTPYTISPIVNEYAKELAKSTGIADARVLFGCTGSDAVEAAIAVALAFGGRKPLIVFEGAYHAGSLLGSGANGFNGLRHCEKESSPLFIRLPFPEHGCGAQVYRACAQLISSDSCAGVLMETVQGDGGVKEPEKNFLPRIRALLTRYNKLLILDEIQSGLMRTGTLWAYKQYGVIPDIMCSGKGLGGGYAALSACIGRADVINSLSRGGHVFSMSGHPPSVAVGLAVLRVLKKEKIAIHVRRVSDDVCQEFLALRSLPIFAGVRGRGLMLGLVLRSHDSIGPVIGRMALERGVYLGFYGDKNNVLRIQPALTIPRSTARRAARSIVRVCREYARKPEYYLQKYSTSSAFEFA